MKPKRLKGFEYYMRMMEYGLAFKKHEAKRIGVGQRIICITYGVGSQAEDIAQAFEGLQC